MDGACNTHGVDEKYI